MNFGNYKPLNQIIDNLNEKQKYWIVFTGDSITSCEWVHPNWRDIVIYVLHEEISKLMNGDWKTPSWGVRGFNFAFDGATTADILHKTDKFLELNPDLVIGLMGGNDPTFGISVDESIRNISQIADKILTNETDLVWCNSTPAGKGSKKNSEYEPYAQAFLNLPDREGMIKIDMFNTYQEFPTERFFTFISEENPYEGVKAGEIDLQHPNQLGNAYIAKVILSEVFGIDFDPDKYIETTLRGDKYPSY